MGGIPKIGQFLGLRDELTQPAPEAEVLGVVKPELIAPTPPTQTVSWGGEGGTPPVSVTDPPPPWELEDVGYAPSDARRYVDVPATWCLRWINPKLLESMGWRYWQPVMASDPRVKVKVTTMVGPDNNIRRGGHIGDILGWMYMSWVESRRKQLQAKTDRLTESAVARQESLKEASRRGAFGPYVQIEGKHPTHTMAEGKSLQDV